MDVMGWLILIFVVLGVAAMAFVVFQRRRRSGSVIATKGQP
jgi:hypothetical protein